jgi:inner membrane protein
MPNETTTSSGQGSGPGLKFIMVAVLTLLMAIPLMLMNVVLSERQSRSNEANTDVATGWGGMETIAGPFLIVPYEETVTTNENGITTQQTRTGQAVLLPANLSMKGRADAFERSRGIFRVPVYQSSMAVQAEFDRDDIARLIPAPAHALWNEASIVMLVSDPHGLADNVVLKANGNPIDFVPGTGIENAAGMHVMLGLTGAPAGPLKISTNFSLRGSRELDLAPLGRQTVAELSSSWRDPSFSGVYLPTQRTVTKDGFDASWKIPYLARGFGESFTSPQAAFQQALQSNFGVRFYQPVDFYQLVARSLKYAALFVGLSFVIFLVMELVGGSRLHPIQYVLFGSAQALFYLLLLSFAEHIGFTAAYIVAATATVVLTGLYVHSALKSFARSASLTAILGCLYGLLYVVLIQEDDALLIGSSVLFFVLAGTMFATRRIDWYRVAEIPALRRGV